MRSIKNECDKKKKNQRNEEKLAKIMNRNSIIWQNIEEEEENECIICLEEYQNDQKVIKLECHKSHMFHSECLREYVSKIKKDKCPIC